MKKFNKYNDLLFIIIFIIVTGYSLFLFMKPNLEKNSLKRNISKYEVSKEYNFLYFDDTISDANRKLYVNYINKYENIVPLLKENNTKIVISGDSISNTADKLLNNNNNYASNMLGLYFDKYNLIIIKDYNAETVNITVTEDMKNKAEGEYKEFIMDKESYYLKDLYTEEELININNNINSNVFYHELGHFLANEKKFNFSEFKEIYNTEKDILFPSEEKEYIKSSLDEFTAECISNYLNYGYVQEVNIELNDNSIKCNEFIKEFIEKAF